MTATEQDATLPRGWIAVGMVQKPVGLKGACAVSEFGNTLRLLTFPCKVLCVQRYTGEQMPRTLNSSRIDPKGMVLFFEESPDRSAAEVLRDHYICLAQEELPALPGDSFYHFELEGMAVLDDAVPGRKGEVKEVQNFPSIDALLIRWDGGKTDLVPMTPQAVQEIDRAGRQIRIDSRAIEEYL